MNHNHTRFFACGCAIVFAVAPLPSRADPPPSGPAPSCDDRPTCNTSNIGHEIITRTLDGLKRTVDSPNAQDRAKETHDAVQCVLQCINDVIKQTPQRVDKQSEDPPPK